jgi:hypothetical protein
MVLEEGKRVERWLKEEFRKCCAGQWDNEEKEFYIEIDGVKVYGHADGVPTLEGFGPAIAESKACLTTDFAELCKGRWTMPTSAS